MRDVVTTPVAGNNTAMWTKNSGCIFPMKKDPALAQKIHVS